MQVLSTDASRSAAIGYLFLAALIGDMELAHLRTVRPFINQGRLGARKPFKGLNYLPR